MLCYSERAWYPLQAWRLGRICLNQLSYDVFVVSSSRFYYYYYYFWTGNVGDYERSLAKVLATTPRFSQPRFGQNTRSILWGTSHPLIEDAPFRQKKLRQRNTHKPPGPKPPTREAELRFIEGASLINFEWPRNFGAFCQGRLGL